MKEIIFCFSIILIFVSFSHSHCEEIFMRNGDHFSGILSFVSSEVLTVETEYGKMNIPKEKILKIIFCWAKKIDLKTLIGLENLD